ncbi:MAG UNVERIFIED_CONTAM: hypothetical protein LVT10_12065 [Anaerolineae bacterium]|jgi:hypothetical protein
MRWMITHDENKNAVIEAFTIPFSGTYSIEVSGFEQTSGTYRPCTYIVVMQMVIRLNNFVDGEEWQSTTQGEEVFTVKNRVPHTLTNATADVINGH